MLHMADLPSIKERCAILQAKYILRSHHLPNSALFTLLHPYVKGPSSKSTYLRLSRSPIWNRVQQQQSVDHKVLNQCIREFRTETLHELQQPHQNSKLLSACRTSISIDLILWHPMTSEERSRCFRWRLGWLSGGHSNFCFHHSTTIM
ncbi:hypothetical protein BDF20DRAFT_887796, partial [Mycotypha africana]|uniref:uncharacterized protein n=1 Tax=Mycotypha africana TaxID=64632 RepID=UPI0022FFC968